MMTRNVVTE